MTSNMAFLDDLAAKLGADVSTVEYVGGGGVIGALLGYLLKGKAGAVAGGVLGGVGGYLVEKYLPGGQIGGKPGPLPGNPDFPLGAAGTANEWVGNLETAPVVGNLLADEFSAAYGVGYSVGEDIKGLGQEIFSVGQAVGQAAGSWLKGIGL